MSADGCPPPLTRKQRDAAQRARSFERDERRKFIRALLRSLTQLDPVLTARQIARRLMDPPTRAFVRTIQRDIKGLKRRAASDRRMKERLQRLQWRKINVTDASSAPQISLQSPANAGSCHHVTTPAHR